MTLPTAPSRTMDQDTFDTTVDAFIGALPGFETDMNVLANTVANDAAAAALSETNAATSETAAALSETNAATSAALAGSYATAEAWVSGTTYAYGDIVISPANARIYRRIVAGAGATDPSLDPTNWSLSTVDGTVNDVVLNAVNKTYHTPVGTTIVQNIVYDTREDSDGGAWRKRCQHTSWYKETIYGKWLGERTNETAARAVSGATTNDYYHNTTDGKFYALNAGSGQTEVFRGNRREFPEQVIIIVEPARVVIYDATDSSIPMWMVFRGDVAAYAARWASVAANIASVASRDGVVIFGGANPIIFNFAKDWWDVLWTSQYGTQVNGLANRNTGVGAGAGRLNGHVIVNATVNSVAVTTLPDAPIDSATGLPVPTIAVATAGGVSVIKQDGTVVNSASTTAAYGVSFDDLGRLRWNTTTEYNCSPVPPLSASFTASSATEPKLSSAAYSSSNVPLGIVIASATGKSVKNAIASTNGLILYRAGQSSAALFADITKDYNTGWMVGDERVAFLCNSETADRSISGLTLVKVGSPTETVNAGGRNVYSNYTSANYYQIASNAAFNALGTGDFSIRMSGVKWGTAGNNRALITLGNGASAGSVMFRLDTTNKLDCFIHGGVAITDNRVTSTATFTDTAEHTLVFKRISGVFSVEVDGTSITVSVLGGSMAATISNATGFMRIGEAQHATQPLTGGQVSCVRISATAPTAEQSKFIAETENKLNGGTACLLAGTSNSVTALGYDKKNDLLHVATSYGRSTFNNLQRVESEATAVGAPVSFSAYDGTLLQAGTSAKVAIPAKYLRDELYRAAEDAARQADSQTSYSFTSSGTTKKLPQGMKATGGVMFNSTDATHSVPVQTFDGFAWTLTGLTNAKVYNLMIRRA